MMANIKTKLLLAALFCVLLGEGCSSSKKKEALKAEAGPTMSENTRRRARTGKRRNAGEKIKEVRRGAATDTEMVVAATAPGTASSESFQPRMPGKRIAQVSVPGPYVALTFDDGPSAAYTPHVLDILRRYNARATFFVLGENAARNKEILARAVAEGHEVGSHTWSHIRLTGTDMKRVRSEMERTSEVIREATGRYPAIMRPPYGATNETVMNEMMQNYGMPSILWDVDTADWKHPGVSAVVNRAVGKAKNGSIILLHDIHASTLAAVEGVVKGLQARGFTLVTVSELIEMGRRAANGERVREARKTQPGQSPSRGLWLTPMTAEQERNSGSSLPTAPAEPVISAAPADITNPPSSSASVASDRTSNAAAEAGRTPISES